MARSHTTGPKNRSIKVIFYREVDEGHWFRIDTGGGSLTIIDITLPDGTVNEYAAGITCGEVIVDALGKKNGCLAALVDGQQKDMSHACLLYTSPSPRD